MDENFENRMSKKVQHVTLGDPSEFRPVSIDSILSGNKDKQEFRNFKDSSRDAYVRKTYYSMHKNQTLDFVKEKREKWLQFNHAELSIMEALFLLDDLVDESDPDIGLPNSVHAFQTAERIREQYPDEDWLQLTGLLHDLGKVMALWSEPQWCVVGDTFPVGCSFQKECVFHEFFAENPDSYHDVYSTLHGIYSANCGLDNVFMSWGHDEYMYNVLKENQCTLPDEALYIIRYHSFYPYHTNKAYMHLTNEKDEKMLKWLNIFNGFDLYSKTEVTPDVEAIRPYYQSLIDKYIPGNLKW